MPSPQKWMIGPHAFHFEPPDVLHITYQGALDPEQAVRMVALKRELAAACPLYTVVDMRNAHPLEPEVQRYLSENALGEWFLATIYFGSRLVHRAMIKGIVLASHATHAQSLAHEQELLRRGLNTIHFTSTREEAEQLIQTLRASAFKP
ncbi:MAG: hypothetical protein ABW123_08715 [Cystobacter sp.]